MALIEMKGVTKKYRRSTTALRDINVSVDPGEFVYIVGPSGAGKSSFIKLLYREEKFLLDHLKSVNSTLQNLKNVKSQFYVVASV
ncbi:Cell division transporter, ATP-binding protein FtsE [Streptococcus sp. HSISB1]|nr:Cell division transporter, ATP-binding protein FtsE [Streptococcus sp. HSISB1]